MDLEKSAAKKKKLSQSIRDYVKNFSDSLNLGNHVAESLIGIEMNAEYIKLLKLNNPQSPTLIENFAVARTPTNAMVGNEIKDTSKIAKCLKSIIKKQQLTSKKVALSITRNAAIIKMINVDSRLNTDEIESRVWIEAKRLFPTLVGDIYLDFVVNGLDPHDKNQLSVMLVACRKDQIDPYLDVLRHADLVPAIIDVDTYAMERALNILMKQSPDKKTLALLNISFTLMSLIVIHEGALIYTHELSYDGRALMQKNVRHEPISDDELRNVLSLHLRHTLQFFYSSRPNVRIDEFYISGDVSAAISNCAALVETEINKKIVLSNPFKDMKLANDINTQELNKSAPGMMLTCGLAMSKLELKL